MTVIESNTSDRDRVYQELLRLNNYDMSYDWFQEIYENELSERKNKKQDFTPRELGIICSKITIQKGTMHEPTAGNGSMIITGENRYHLYSLMRLRASGPGYPASSNVHRRGRYDSDCRTVYEKEFRRDSQKAFKTPSDCRSGGLFAGTSGSDSRRFPEERVTLSGD